MCVFVSVLMCVSFCLFDLVCLFACLLACLVVRFCFFCLSVGLSLFVCHCLSFLYVFIVCVCAFVRRLLRISTRRYLEAA